MSYLPHTDNEVALMLERIGLANIESSRPHRDLY